MLPVLLLLLGGFSEWPLLNERTKLLTDGSWALAEQEMKYEPVEEADLPLCTSGIGNYDGAWVYDEEANLRYETSSKGIHCAYCLDNVALNSNESKDEMLSRVSEAVKWKWQPRTCKYVRLHPKSFIDQMSGKRLLLIGDSVVGEVFHSLFFQLGGNVSAYTIPECEQFVTQMKEECMTEEVLSRFRESNLCDNDWIDCKLRSFVSIGKHKTNFVEVDMLRADYLGVRSWIHDYRLRDKENRLSRLWSIIAKKKYDVVLFDTGLHWHPDTKILDIGFSFSSLLKIFSHRISHIFSDVFAGSPIIFMPIWQPNYCCCLEDQPLKNIMQYWKNSSCWDLYNNVRYLPDINLIWINAWQHKNELFYTLDTTVLSLNPLGRVGCNTLTGRPHCVHAILPGVYDVIGDWLWTLLVSIFRI